jgi:hypothetical protein
LGQRRARRFAVADRERARAAAGERGDELGRERRRVLLADLDARGRRDGGAVLVEHGDGPVALRR